MDEASFPDELFSQEATGRRVQLGTADLGSHQER